MAKHKARQKAKFRAGQVVLNLYYRDDYIKIKAIRFGAASNDNEQWAYSDSPRNHAGMVWFEESMLRALTRSERGED